MLAIFCRAGGLGLFDARFLLGLLTVTLVDIRVGLRLLA